MYGSFPVCLQAYKYLREEVQMFQGKPIMVRIKAETMAVTSYGPVHGYGQVNLDKCGSQYGSYYSPASYQQPCPAHMSTQQLYDFTNEVRPVSGYSVCPSPESLITLWCKGHDLCHFVFLQPLLMNDLMNDFPAASHFKRHVPHRQRYCWIGVDLTTGPRLCVRNVNFAAPVIDVLQARLEDRQS